MGRDFFAKVEKLNFAESGHTGLYKVKIRRKLNSWTSFQSSNGFLFFRPKTFWSNLVIKNWRK